MIFRLECLTEDHNPPSPSLVHVEHILVDLANDPVAVLRPDLSRCILSLRQPLSYITEDERLTMRKVALVADEGLTAAIEELLFVPERIDMRNLRILRESLTIIGQELKDAKCGEWRVFRALWDEGEHGLTLHLVDILVALSDNLKGNFLLTPPSRMPQKLVEELFHTSTDVIKLIAGLLLAYPPMSRSTRTLTIAVANIFACADTADVFGSQSRSFSTAATRTRQTCIDFARCLSMPQVSSEPGRPISEVVLRTLLEHGAKPDERDPAHHLPQVYCLIDHLLPASTTDEVHKSSWVTSVIPAILPEIWAFFRVLDTLNKVQFLKRLVILDAGVVGVGEWLFLEELRRLQYVSQSLHDDIEAQLHFFRQHEILLSLRFLLEITASSSLSAWCISSIANLPEAAQTLAQCLMCLLDAHLSSPCLSQIVRELTPSCGPFDPMLRFALALASLRLAQELQSQKLAFDILSTSLGILRDLPEDNIDMDRLAFDVGQTLSTFASSDSILEGLDVQTAETITSVLDWISQSSRHHSAIPPRINVASFEKLHDRMQQVLLPHQIEPLQSVLSKITVERENSTILLSTDLADSIQLSIQDVENLLYPPAPSPRTPKANTPDLLSLVTISPPTAILRSPAATGLTKTYSNNDFRQLRQLPSARQNTSRLPSMHVDVGTNSGLNRIHLMN
jgi:hypothetical protein